jgi:hypothetical protein
MIQALAALGRPFVHGRVAFGLVALVLAGVVALQAWLQTGGRNDDAELLLFSQTLALGYDPLNPPLVVWLHWLIAEALGPTLLSTRVLVAVLLFAAFPLAWAATRQLAPDRGMATLAGLSLAGLVAWNWAPHINLTHTVALTTASFALLWGALGVVQRPNWGRWLLLGLIAGLGLLTKYSFVLVLLAVVLAGLATPTTRAVMRSWKMLAAALVTTIVAVPHYVWLLLHWSAAGPLFSRKLSPDPSVLGHWEASAPGLATLGEHALMVLLPAVAVALLLFLPTVWRALRRPEPIAPVTRDRRDFARLVPVLFLVELAALVVVADVTLKPHHVYPLILVVVPLFAWLARGRPGPTERGLYALVMVLLTLAVPAFMARFILTTADACEDKCNLVLPYATYADGVRDAGFEGGTVVLLGTVHHLPLENLRPHLPASRFVRPADSQKASFAPPARPVSGDCLVLWPAERMPEAVDTLRADGIPGQDAVLPEDATIGTVTGVLAHSGRPAPTLGYALAKGGAGVCR